MLSAQIYVDSLTGISGNNSSQDPIIADVVTSGGIEFQADKSSYYVQPGQICVRDSKASWRFSCSSATTVHVISIPRHAILPYIGSTNVLDQAYVSDNAMPEVKFLLRYLEVIKRSSNEMEASPTARQMALGACASLLTRIVSERPGLALDDHPGAIVAAAKIIIEENIGREDLSPAVVARSVGVSVRTLHRSFSATEDSVMAFVRQRRMEEAHDELVNPGKRTAIAEIAARWCFSDASHFIRKFKAAYGSPPTAYLRELGKRP
ncbi:helix-turn-helix domain-containing protein [Streptomyces sp. NPDC088354]|uniref:helix-turn-helix domain-containing protein n=1 Tax=Streptomyces sp. NPDC088354 TaxID=3365856 RepID=UPI003811F6BA